jgi:hypothetical protein
VLARTGFESAVNIKAHALALMAKAEEAYTKHRNEVGEFMIELDKAYEYDRGLTRNTDIVSLWDISPQLST